MDIALILGLNIYWGRLSFEMSLKFPKLQQRVDKITP